MLAGMRRRAIAIAGVLLTAAAFVPVANASHHLIKIRQVSAGSSGQADLEYVELQMYAGGQTSFAGNGVTVRLYDAAGTEMLAHVLATNPANGGSQRYVLAGNDAPVFATFGVHPDYMWPTGDHIDNAGGAACFTSAAFGNLDCVSWGNYTGVPPSPTGGNVPAITDLAVVHRSIEPGCRTLLEGPDDTNDPADWSELQSPDPFNNAAPPGGGPCPNTTITKTPPSKTTDRTPKFKFKSTPAGASFECKLDDSAYEDCDSPHTTRRLSFGKHKLRVRAFEGKAVDPTPARDSFKVVRG
jgi:hypothetical protein